MSSLVLAVAIGIGVVHVRQPPLTKELLLSWRNARSDDIPDPIPAHVKFARRYGSKSRAAAVYVIDRARQGRTQLELSQAYFAFNVLSEIRDPRARPFLEELDRDISANPDLRVRAMTALLELPGTDTRQILSSLLRSDQTMRRAAAAFYLQKHPDEHVLPALREAVAAERDRRTRSDLQIIEALLEHPGMCVVSPFEPAASPCLFYCRGDVNTFAVKRDVCSTLIPEGEARTATTPRR